MNGSSAPAGPAALALAEAPLAAAPFSATLAEAPLAVLAAVLLVLATVAALLPNATARPNLGRAVYALSAAACLALLGLAAVVLVTGAPLEVRFGTVLGFTPLDIRLDRLGALFVALLGISGTAASLYATGYASHAPEPDRSRAAYPVFLASLFLVFAAGDGIAFLLAWELMALSSAVLVIGSRPDPAVMRAGYTYLALTHLASAALVVAFGLLAAGGEGTSFAGFAAAAGALPPAGRDLLFLLLFTGFATKAGAIPLHVWLPQAHPVAPSPVSALMSGVMIKAGIYGIVRFVIGVEGPGPEWWGLVVLAAGAVSAVLGVLYALIEHDLKRLLAFSSIENIGIILIALGTAMLAAGAGLTAVAGLALAAALLHATNHALMKSLLFLAAGAVQQAAGTRDLNRLGGLARALPVTTLVFVVGAVAISGLPPGNGFAGEWLTFQGLFGAASSPFLTPLARTGTFLAIGALGMAAAIAVAAFVKATGTGFLALPRSAGAAAAREPGRAMTASMAGLAVLCLVAGLAAGPLASGLGALAGDLLVSANQATSAAAAAGAGQAAEPALSAAMRGVGGTVYAAAGIGLLLVLLTGALWFAGIRGRPVRRTPTWTCGIDPEPAFEYTATSYSKLLRLFFGRVLRPSREVEVELHPGTPFPRTLRYRGRASHVIDERLYAPIHAWSIRFSEVARRLQGGSLQLYLAYTVAAVVILLLVARG